MRRCQAATAGSTTPARFTYAGATGTTSMGFESISAGSGSNTIGNFLDNIQIELRPFVEFVQPASATPESASSNLPTLRVNGTAFSAFTVTVQIIGGTATLGTDYTTPGNSPTLTITIPVGQYDGASAASLFALPIAVASRCSSARATKRSSSRSCRQTRRRRRSC